MVKCNPPLPDAQPRSLESWRPLADQSSQDTTVPGLQDAGGRSPPAPTGLRAFPGRCSVAVAELVLPRSDGGFRSETLKLSQAEPRLGPCLSPRPSGAPSGRPLPPPQPQLLQPCPTHPRPSSGLLVPPGTPLLPGDGAPLSGLVAGHSPHPSPSLRPRARTQTPSHHTREPVFFFGVR